MDAPCKNCGTIKDIKKMLRQKFPTKSLSGEVIYGAFHYGYFCDEGCFVNHKEEETIKI